MSLSRNFCLKSVIVNFGNFHTVHFGTTQKSQKIKPFLLQLCEHLVIGKFKRRRNINPYQTSRNHTFNDDFRNRTIIIIKLHRTQNWTKSVLRDENFLMSIKSNTGCIGKTHCAIPKFTLNNILQYLT